MVSKGYPRLGSNPAPRPLHSVCLRAAFYPRHDPRSTAATTKKPGYEPGFSLCDDLQSHQPSANPNPPHKR